MGVFDAMGGMQNPKDAALLNMLGNGMSALGAPSRELDAKAREAASHGLRMANMMSAQMGPEAYRQAVQDTYNNLKSMGVDEDKIGMIFAEVSGTSGMSTRGTPGPNSYDKNVNPDPFGGMSSEPANGNSGSGQAGSPYGWGKKNGLSDLQNALTVKPNPNSNWSPGPPQMPERKSVNYTPDWR